MLEALKRSKLRRLALCVEQGELVEAVCYVISRVGIRLPAPIPRPRPSSSPVQRARSSPRRIVATVHSLAFEGAPISLLEILAGLIRTSGYEVHLVSPTDGPLRARAEAIGCTIHIVESPQNDAGGEHAYEDGLRRFCKFLQSLGPDAVIANSLATFHAVDAARQLVIPTAWLIRESDSPESFFALYPRAVQARGLACIAYPDKTIFASHSTMSRWPRRDGSCTLIRTVPERTNIEQLRSWKRDDARRALGLRNGEVMILTVGTLYSNKGQMDLVRAAGLMHSFPGSIRIALVGAIAAPGGKAVARAAARLRASENCRVEIHPATPDVGMYYAAADLYVCSSRKESYPRTILEALAFGLPLVTTGIDGVVEALAETDARAYRPGDAATLAALLTELAGSPGLRTAMAQSSLRRWKQITQDDCMVVSYAREIGDLLQNSP